MNLKQAARKAYKSTDLYALRQLLKEHTKWQRRHTIATNKLESIQFAIRELAEALAKAKAGVHEERP